MSDQLDKRIKTALNETRLLILGVQVLVGFQFQGAFQDRFAALSAPSQYLSLVTLMLLYLSCALLIAPSMHQRIVERAHSSGRLLRAVTSYASASLLVFAPALGLAVYIVVALHFGATAGVLAGAALALLALGLWFGLELAMGLHNDTQTKERAETPLSTRVEQLLIEARIIIPGAQALLGFQLTIMLTTGFAALDHTAKVVHAVSLAMVAINICLLMTPAALHRLSFGGGDSERFVQIGGALVVTAPLFLASGIAGDLYVVFAKVAQSNLIATVAAVAAFAMAAGLWYVAPLILRARLH